VPPQSRTGRGRPQTRLQRGQHQPISVKTLALSLPQEAWQTITLELTRFGGRFVT
jgi:hypothetical protein